MFGPHPLNGGSGPHVGTTSNAPRRFQTPPGGERYHLVVKHPMWCHPLFTGHVSECLLVTGPLLDDGDIDVKSSVSIN